MKAHDIDKVTQLLQEYKRQKTILGCLKIPNRYRLVVLLEDQVSTNTGPVPVGTNAHILRDSNECELWKTIGLPLRKHLRHKIADLKAQLKLLGVSTT